jgi:hypothetical protein
LCYLNFNTQAKGNQHCCHTFDFFFTNHSHALFRQGVTGGKQHKHDPERRTRESRAVPAPEANAELVSSLQVILHLLTVDTSFIFSFGDAHVLLVFFIISNHT